MKEYSFYGRSLESCLEKGSKALNIPKDKLVYKIINEKKSLLKKTFNITVYVESQIDNSTYHDIVEKKNEEGRKREDNIKTKGFESSSRKSSSKYGSVTVQQGKIKIKDPENNGMKPTIAKGNGISLKVDGKEILGKTSITSQSHIEVSFENGSAKRELNINVSEDKTECYISIKYCPEIIYGLQDVEENNSITLNSVIIKEEYPPLFSEAEIIEALKSKGIIYGYCLENIKKSSMAKAVEEVLVAKGIPVIPSEDDKIEICFQQDSNHEFETDKYGNVDFKSIGNIESVKKGDILCRRILGKEGISGKSIFGQVIKPKKRKIKDIIPKEGCELKDENTIIASIDGKPQVKGNYFSVHIVHKVMGDVDIKTGNIHFIGDVIVYGDVKEGMNIQAGNSIYINSNVFRAILNGGSDISIKGNVISSSIVAGSNYVELIKYMDSLEELATVLKNINNILEQVKSNNISVQTVKDSSLIKKIVDSKQRNFKNKINNTLKYMYILKDTENKVFRLITDKLSDAYFSKVKDYRELKHIEELIREKLERMNGSKEPLSNITLSYVQDSNIEGSGDIIITGKGVYKSYITSMNEIYFVGRENSNVRGGILRAKKEIKAKTVGAPTGVSTILAVSKEGHIYCDLAYLNTKIMVGEKEVILDDSYKNIHGYLNNDLELIVDKFKL